MVLIINGVYDVFIPTYIQLYFISRVRMRISTNDDDNEDKSYKINITKKQVDLS